MVALPPLPPSVEANSSMLNASSTARYRLHPHPKLEPVVPSTTDPHRLCKGFPVVVPLFLPPPGNRLNGPHLLSSDGDKIILRSLGVLLLAPSPLLQPSLCVVLHLSSCAFIALATPAGELVIEHIDVTVVCFLSVDLVVILVFSKDIFVICLLHLKHIWLLSKKVRWVSSMFTDK
jgi:hypothetical protein